MVRDGKDGERKGEVRGDVVMKERVREGTVR